MRKLLVLALLAGGAVVWHKRAEDGGTDVAVQERGLSPLEIQKRRSARQMVKFHERSIQLLQEQIARSTKAYNQRREEVYSGSSIHSVENKRRRREIERLEGLIEQQRAIAEGR